MTGTIVGLACDKQMGTIRCRDGGNLTFAADQVLGDFEALALGDSVSFDVQRGRGNQAMAVRVFREPQGMAGSGKENAAPEVRYAGFEQSGNMRKFRFEAVVGTRTVRQLVVTADLELLLKHNVGMQEAPVLCMRKLAGGEGPLAAAACQELSQADLQDYVSCREAAARKKLRHGFSNRRGAPQGGWRSQSNGR